MQMADLLNHKKAGLALTADEIEFFVSGFTAGDIPDYQAAALLMAICLRGMTDEEAAVLTDCMARSGDQLDLSPVDGVTADKHSTGGVGDKTTLIVAPLCAAAGLKIAKMSGRGLGHTGGTVDKLESIPGFHVALSNKEFFEQVNRVGVSVIGLACIVGGVIAWNGEHFFSSGAMIFAAVFLHNALGYVAGYLVGRCTGMTVAKKRTIAIEVGMQNAGLATNLATRHFPALPEAAIASAVSCVWHSISGTLLAGLFLLCDRVAAARKAKRETERKTE